jgi:hypothetical protein
MAMAMSMSQDHSAYVKTMLAKTQAMYLATNGNIYMDIMYFNYGFLDIKVTPFGIEVLPNNKKDVTNISVSVTVKTREDLILRTIDITTDHNVLDRGFPLNTDIALAYVSFTDSNMQAYEEVLASTKMQEDVYQYNFKDIIPVLTQQEHRIYSFKSLLTIINKHIQSVIQTF